MIFPMLMETHMGPYLVYANVDHLIAQRGELAEALRIAREHNERTGEATVVTDYDRIGIEGFAAR